MTKNQTCETCYKIICKNCGWEADNEDVQKIQKGKLTDCPLCGWQPKKQT